MSILRQDPTTKSWVIIATERATRPDDFKKKNTSPTLPFHDPLCPFCPGNEDKTPPELLRLSAPETTDWHVRVIQNKFAAVSGSGEATRREEGSIFREMLAVGSHEIIVETPVHNQSIPHMDSKEVEQILWACRTRYQALRQNDRIKSIIVFKNHGERAGTSLQHPHCQLVAAPVAPLLTRRKYEVAIAHFDDTGRCLYGDIIKEERQSKTRFLFETEHFVVFNPFASRVPFEIWILPQRQQSSYGQITGEALVDLAHVLHRCLSALHQALGEHDYNFIIHSSPTDDETKTYFVWHVQIIPRVNTIAGFELGSGIFINTMLPEDCADYLRKYCP